MTLNSPVFPLFYNVYGYSPGYHDFMLSKLESWIEDNHTWTQFTISCLTPDDNDPEIQENEASDTQSFLHVIRFRDYAGVVPCLLTSNDIYEFEVNIEDTVHSGKWILGPVVSEFLFTFTDVQEVSLHRISKKMLSLKGSKDKFDYRMEQIPQRVGVRGANPGDYQ